MYEFGILSDMAAEFILHIILSGPYVSPWCWLNA